MYFIVYANGRKIIDGESDSVEQSLIETGMRRVSSLGDEVKYMHPDVPGIAVYVRPNRSGINTEASE